jgi:hypothetical protein
VHISRFLREDPLSFTAGDTNLYRYVFNNPTALTDPTGEIVPVIVGTLVVFGGVGLLEWATCRYKYATDYYLGKPLSEWSPELQEEFRRYVRQTDWIAACGEVAGYTGVTMVGSPYLGKMIADTWAYNGACHELGKLLVISMASFGSCEVIGEGIDIYRQWDLLTPPDRFRRVGDLGGPLFAGGLCGGWGGGQVRPSPRPIPPLLSPLLPQPRRIYSARVLIRMDEMRCDSFHNFPMTFDEHICRNGQRIVIRDDYIEYHLRGGINKYEGTYEIGVCPSPSGRNEVIIHRFFRPCKE